MLNFLCCSTPKPQPVQWGKRFLRKSNMEFDWRMTECYVCYREFGDMPRAFPFDCDHEICKECFVRYTNHRHSAKRLPPNCGICDEPIREEWKRSHIICSREVAPREWIWIPEPEYAGTHTSPVKLDTLQYQLAHGMSPPEFRGRAFTV
jgi:hypothetical protein